MVKHLQFQSMQTVALTGLSRPTLLPQN